MVLSGWKTGIFFSLLFFCIGSVWGLSEKCLNGTSGTFACDNTGRHPTQMTTENHAFAMTTDGPKENISSTSLKADVALETTDPTLTTDLNVAMGTATIGIPFTSINITSGGDERKTNDTAAIDDVKAGSDDMYNGPEDVNDGANNVNSGTGEANTSSDVVTVPLMSSDPVLTLSEKNGNTTLESTVTSSPNGFAEESSGTPDFIQTFRLYLVKSTLALDSVGIVLNTMSLTVLYQMRSSISNTYLLILTACDTIFVVMNVPYNAMQLVFTTRPSMPWVYAYYRLYFEIPMHVASRNTAAVVCAAMASDRFLKIAFPLRNTNKSWLYRPVPLAVVTGVLIYGYVLLDLAVRLKVGEAHDPATNSSIVGHIPTRLYVENFDLISTLFLVVNCFVRYLPTVVLIVANISLLVSLSLHSRGMNAIINSRDISRNNSSKSIRSAKLVLIFSFVFLLLSLPFVVYTILMMVYQDMGVLLDPILVAVWGMSLPSFDALNSSINFFVLSAANPVFRHGVKVLIFERGIDMLSGTGHSSATS